MCAVYAEAQTRAAWGEHVVSVDEMTGIQALERAAPTKLCRPGLVERREHNYIRHGTLTLIANLDVATGQLIVPSIGPTRTEADFATHIADTIATDPTARWTFVLDNLNTHQSEALVRLVANHLQWDTPLGIKGDCGILASLQSRAAFLSDPTHAIRFVYTPKHASWLNQIEIWFSILVRRLLKRGSFASLHDLYLRLLDFIFYFNRSAHPFKWTYAGRPLHI